MKQADVVIIGGGIIGTAIALELSRRQTKRVVLIEKSGFGAGSTGKSGAILRQHYSHNTTIMMARKSLEFYRGFEANFGSDIGFRNTGMVFIAKTADRAALETNVNLQKSLGVKVELLDHAALTKRVPDAALEGDYFGGFEEEAGFVDPTKSVEAFGLAARDHGTEIMMGEKVDEIIRNGDKVAGVKLASGQEIACDIVVNAAGPWAGKLLDKMGLEFPLTAVRPEQAYLAPPIECGPERHIFLDIDLGIYWKPMPVGWTRIGNMDFDQDEKVADPDHYDEGVSHEFIEFTRNKISQRMPKYKKGISWGGCGALYTVTPDAQPLIGPVDSVEGLYVVSGFSGHGFKMGPAVGFGVAAMIHGADTDYFDPSYFAPSRFHSGGSGQATNKKFKILG